MILVLLYRYYIYISIVIFQLTLKHKFNDNTRLKKYVYQTILALIELFK